MQGLGGRVNELRKTCPQRGEFEKNKQRPKPCTCTEPKVAEWGTEE